MVGISYFYFMKHSYII